MVKLPFHKHRGRQQTPGDEFEILLHGCRLNDRVAQKELYSRYYGYGMSIALRYASNYDDAVEMINDAFLKIYKDLKKFVPRYENTVSSFTAWLKMVIVSACIDHLRKYSKKDTTLSMDPLHTVIEDSCENAESRLLHKEIIYCLRQLSPAYKAVFNLYAIEGFSHAEIAAMLNISEGTSKSNFHKARQNLQVLLKKRNSMPYEKTV